MVIDVSSRLSRLRQRMAEAEVDTLYINSPVNRRYLSGFTGSAGAVVLRQDQAWLLVDFRYVEQAKEQAPGFQLVEIKKMTESLSALFQEIGARRVGFESQHVTVHAYRQLTEAIPGVEWVPTEQWVESIRGIKDEAELVLMQKAIDLTDAAFSHILDFLAPGRTEREIAMELEFFMRRGGAERLSFPPIVASGPNGALPHAVPTDRQLQKGDLVTLDFGCVVGGYCSDLTRTVVVGSADEKARSLYELVLEAQEAGIQGVTPGRTGREVDAIAREVIAAAGYGDRFGHGLGHGVGLEVHEEFPRLSVHSDVVLAPGMVTSVEPGVYIPGWGGIRIEDLVLVEADGRRILSRSDKQLLVV